MYDQHNTRGVRAHVRPMNSPIKPTRFNDNIIIVFSSRHKRCGVVGLERVEKIIAAPPDGVL